MKKMILGLMSGTSLDGLDIAGAEIWQRDGKLEHGEVFHQSFHYPAGLRSQVLAVTQGRALEARDFLFLHHDLGAWMADSAAEAVKGWGVKRVDGAGMHGQTVWHEPHRISGSGGALGATWQLGEPAYLAKALGCPVVFDLRTNDLVLGGQGAPLVPLAQQALLSEADLENALLTMNLGGIANGALFRKNTPVAASDFGPANVWLDTCLALYGHDAAFDEGGRIAAQGEVNEGFLSRLWNWDGFARQTPPKSTGREHYTEENLLRLLGDRRPSLQDALRTLVAYSARCIATGVRQLGLPEREKARLCVSGGGAHHAAMMEAIGEALGGAEFVSPQEIFGLGTQIMEAFCFAVLAWLHQTGARLGEAGVTGIQGQTVYGKACEF